MNKEQLFESLQGVDDVLLERSEHASPKRGRWKGWAAAACLCLLGAVAAFWNNGEPAPPVSLNSPPVEHTSLPTSVPERTWTLYYNEETEGQRISADWAYAPGCFTQALDETALTAVAPETLAEWMACAGTAGFSSEGTLLVVRLEVTTTLPDCPVTVELSQSPLPVDCVFSGESVTSLYGQIRYTAHQWTAGSGRTILQAETQRGDCYFYFTMTVDDLQLNQAKEDFQTVLECFGEAAYSPDLSQVTAQSIPEWIDQALTLDEALADPDFGAWMLREVPQGFGVESICRYKDQNFDTLSGLWTKGMSELRWTVSRFQESNENRQTAVADRENYDLSLYPIPRADSVPEALREIVDNPIFNGAELTPETVWARAYQVADSGDETGWRLRFTVRYGDILVEVSGKGIDPQWIYQRLTGLSVG